MLYLALIMSYYPRGATFESAASNQWSTVLVITPPIYVQEH